MNSRFPMCASICTENIACSYLVQIRRCANHSMPNMLFGFSSTRHVNSLVALQYLLCNWNYKHSILLLYGEDIPKQSPGSSIHGVTAFNYNANVIKEVRQPVLKQHVITTMGMS